MTEISNYELKKNAEGYKDIVPHDAIKRYEKTAGKKPVFRGNIHYINDRYICLVVSNCYNNKYSDRIEIVYLSTTFKWKPLPTHVFVDVFEPCVIKCENIYTVPRNMIGRFLKQLTEEEMKRVDYALAVSIGLANPYPNKE